MRHHLQATGGRHRQRRLLPLGCGLAAFAGLALAAAPAGAVVIDTLTGTGNTSAPVDDPGWANVGVRGIGTGVYLGDGWVITAAHVGGGSTVLSGTSYAMLAGSGTTLTNNGAVGKSAATDLYLFRLASPPPDLPAVTIAATAAAHGEAVTMIGAGRDRGAFTEWSVNTGTTPWVWTEVSSGGDAAGYQTLSGRSMRWGTNSVTASGLWVDDGFADVNAFATDFTFSGTPSNEAQAAYGDSGGAIFRNGGSGWELSGLILAVGGYSGQPDPGTHAIYGNVTYAADLSFYRSQIVSIVPEPSAVALLAAAAAAAAARASGRIGRSRRVRTRG